VALALVEEDRGRPFSSGLALSLCLYKPTLLVLLVPMLVVTGRLQHIVGFAAGAAAQSVLWLLTGGVASIRAFVEELQWTISRTTAETQLFNPYRYVDVNAFVRLLPYGRSTGATIAAAAIAGAA